MRGYSDIWRSTSASVHFVEAEWVDETLSDIRRDLDEAGISLAYIDCRRLLVDPRRTCDTVAAAIGAEHAPYEEESWFRLLDDMITLARTKNGLVIVMDHADTLYEADRVQIFSLVEAFLTQLHHWLERHKPCHLCFQMSPHPLVAQIFRQRDP